jgi:hypothetical protein
VLFDVLSLAACSLAKRDWEHRFAIMCCDLTRVGCGIDGFGLDELPMQPDSWESDREFILRVVDLACTRHRWDVLGYDPPFALDGLQSFGELVAGYVPSFPLRERAWRWPLDSIEEAVRLCPDHPVFLGSFAACRFCD